MAISRNGRPVGAADAEWLGNRVVLGALDQSDTVTLTFPQARQKLSYSVNANSPQEQEYTLDLRGSTVVDISPRDESPTSYPLYLRDYLKADRTPFKTIQRFVPDRMVSGW
jgi:hypothetical protein